MEKTTEESFQCIRKSWIGGNGTMYFGIPSKIVSKLRLKQDGYLLVDLVDESIIIIKKHTPQFSKNEIARVRNFTSMEKEDSKETNGQPVEIPGDDFKNPLDNMD